MVVETTIEHKFFAIDLPAKLKSLDEAQGIFEGYASTHSLDLQSDKVAPGAFARTLAEAKEARTRRGDQFLLPLLYSHDPERPIGAVIDAFEDNRGLKIRGFVDMDIPEGRRAFSGMSKGYLSAFSIGYRVKRSSREPYGVRVLEDLDLIEISLVTFPAQPEARVVAVKGGDSVNDLALAMIGAMKSLIEKYGGKDMTRVVNPLTEAEQEAHHNGVVIFMDGKPGETRQSVIKEMLSDLRHDDDLYTLHGKAFDRELEARKQQREKQRAAQKAVLEQERKEAAERHAAQSALSFTPATFAAAYGLDEPFVRGRFSGWVSAGFVTPISEAPLTLDGNDARRQARREWERFEARFIEMASRRVQGAA